MHARHYPACPVCSRCHRLYRGTTDHTGYTIQSQPGLYWYAAFNGNNASMQITLMNAKSDEVLLEENTTIMNRSGIYRLNLSDYDFALQPATEYRWVVRLQQEQNGNPTSIVASGSLVRVEPPADPGALPCSTRSTWTPLPAMIAATR